MTEPPKEAVEAAALVFWYRNYKGEEGYRHVQPISIRYGTSEWHPEKQWLLLAYDTVNDKQREFAMKDISSVVGSPIISVATTRPTDGDKFGIVEDRRGVEEKF